MPDIEKIAIIGLDCADPVLLFDRWLADLPNLRRLCEKGTFGHLTSCVPPITVPAWSCMASSKDPGKLGIYGFRNRADHSYEKLSIATSLAVREPRLWDLLGGRGQSSIVIGFPGTFPIVRPIRGYMVTGFLSPDIDCDYTHPKTLTMLDRISWHPNRSARVNPALPYSSACRNSPFAKSALAKLRKQATWPWG